MKITKSLLATMEEEEDEEEAYIPREDPLYMYYESNCCSENDEVSDENIKFHEMK